MPKSRPMKLSQHLEALETKLRAAFTEHLEALERKLRAAFTEHLEALERSNVELQQYRDHAAGLAGVAAPTGAPGPRDQALREVLTTNVEVGRVAMDELASTSSSSTPSSSTPPTSASSSPPASSTP